MPKNRITVKLGNNVHSLNAPNKFRIGARDDGKSAHFMSNDELKEVLSNKSKKRYVANATAVLKLRNISV